MVVGKLVETAALGIKHSLIDAGYLPPLYIARRVPGRVQPLRRGTSARCTRTSQYQPPPGLRRGTTRSIVGDAYGTYGWAVYVAEVSVDTTTWETRVDDFVAVQEVGRVINPTLAAGQIEGGVAQGIGWALYEDVVWREGPDGERADDELHHADVDGPAADPRLSSKKCRIRTARRGAKGIGELPMDGPAPAILNASRTRPAWTCRSCRSPRSG